jgi:uncharacterized protein (DUF1778 family)
MPKNRRTLTAPKTGQLQIRVSRSQKLAIQRQARKARMSMSEWILQTLLPSAQATFQTLVAELAASEQPSYAFAELLEFLGPLDAPSFEAAVVEPPAAALDAYWQNYLAATVEQAAAKKQAKLPDWTREIAPLAEPHFGSSLASLRLHLLLNSPPPFVVRNLFIDANVGDRV